MEHKPRPSLLVSLVLSMVLGGCGGAIPEAPHRARPQTVIAYQPIRPDEGQCLSDLGAKAAGFTPLPDQYYGAGCATFNAVRLASLSGDSQSFNITNLGPVTCPLANTFAGWARFGVDRAARAILGSPLVRIETMGSYSCRNVAGTDRRSAHATGNAIDVAAFVLADGRRITVLNGWNSPDPAERDFLRTVHQSACRRFGTTLGPDFNAAHRNHLHVDLTNNGICH
ncbi:extensin-like domain-containing protein [Novosphingobium sp. KACC 22771]|uniref:extensin-like domain-containing protein n=1 Tax=Novosphingobium sp. KACC 22771 TaxID=3025670 RepID=UPI0023667B7E|nr:extensin family protein [Novosphingobium sp. KACC 22771]WDF73316.1 extensin family protein [Novosphingobium sp. KACC 22771]